MRRVSRRCSIFVIKHRPPPHISPLSLHDALPIYKPNASVERTQASLMEKDVFLETLGGDVPWAAISAKTGDRKSTRLNSSHQIISYAVFCLKKKTDSVQDINIGKCNEDSKTFFMW